MGAAVDELWFIARDAPLVDAATLARAPEAAVNGEPLDYRTRLVVRDGVRALRNHWRTARFDAWLDGCSSSDEIQREKDRDDLRAIAPQLDRDTFIRRIRETTGSFRADPKLLASAEKNWFILFGEPLPA
jgi:hypothetical protein